VHLRERVVDGGFAAAWAVLRVLPEPLVKVLGNGLADFTWRRRGKGVRQLEANLARVRPQASQLELRELSRAGMRSYLRYWMEAFRLPWWGDRKIADSVRVEGLEYLVEAMEANRGAVLALPHMANWDLAGAWVARHVGYPFTTVAERLKPESLYVRFVAYREALGFEVLALTGSDLSVIATLSKRLRAGKLVCLVGDRDLSEAGLPVTFFGETTRMPAGPAALAQRTGAALLPVSLWYDGPMMRGRIHPPVEVPESEDRVAARAAMTQAMADIWAEEIARHPQDWHMLQKLWLADLPRRPQPARAADVPAPAGEAAS
jgi:KDO2-lipid IV(A) lauroyltransferase